MIRTQVSISEVEYKAAKRESKKLGISLAEYFRRAVRAALRPNPNKPWMKYCGFVATGDSQSSTNIDEIIYGQKE